MTEVKQSELQELYAKAYTYKESLAQIRNTEHAQGYLRFLAKNPEGLVKMKIAYGQMYPEDQEGNELINKELDNALKFDPALVALYIKNIVTDLAVLYGRAFKLFLENLSGNKKQETTAERNPQQAQSVQSQTATQFYEQAKQQQTQKQKESVWKRMFGRRKPTIARVAPEEIRAEQNYLNSTPKATISQREADERLARYNASVKARAQGNMARESYANQKINENAMQRSA